MTFARATNAAVKHLKRSAAARTYRDRAGRPWAVDLEHDIAEYPDLLTITTWGFDHASITIPETRIAMIRGKMHLQLRMMDGPLCALDQIRLRFYLDILHREAA